MTRLTSVGIPPVSKEAYDKVVAAFGRKKFKDNVNLFQVGKSEGHQEVIDFLFNMIGDSYISGDQKDIDIREQTYTPTQKLFQMNRHADTE